MKRLLLILFLIPLLAQAYTESPAGTLNTDGSRADVAAAIAAAVDGNTVTIPAGSFTWTSGVTISGKGIKLQGAGGGRVEGVSTTAVTFSTGSRSFTIRSGSTINGFTASESIVVRDKFVAGNTMTGTVTSWDGSTLVVNVTAVAGSSPTNKWTFEMPETTSITHSAGSSTLIQVTKDASNSTEITGIRLIEGTVNGGYGIRIGGTGKTALVHDMRFSSIHQGVRDDTNGLILWKCYFDAGFNISTDNTNNDNGVQMTVASLTSSWTDANTVGMNDSAGTANSYVEQCFFTGLVLGCVDLGDNFRGAFRYCVLDNSSVTLHGQDTDAYGCRQIEIYNNLFVMDSLANPLLSANLNYWITWRGGSGIVTDNTMDDVTSWSWGSKNEITLEYQTLRRADAVFGALGWPGGADGTVIRYPASHQPGQGSNGAAAWYTLGGDSLYTATNTYTEGVYIYSNTGTSVAVAVNYAPAMGGVSPSRSISDYIQLNRDYFTAAPQTGTPFYGYTKYTYPHPLRTDLGATVNAAANPRKISLPLGF